MTIEPLTDFDTGNRSSNLIMHRCISVIVAPFMVAKGELDNAITDFEQGNKTPNPDYVNAYNGRGLYRGNAYNA